MIKKSFPRKYNPKGRSDNNVSKQDKTWKNDSSTIPENSKRAAIEFDPTKRDCLSQAKAKPKIILMFKQNKCWNIVNYEDHGIEFENGIIQFHEEELGPEPKQDAYVHGVS